MGDNFTLLSELMIASETVTYNGQKLKVRGLSVPHISMLIRSHREILADYYMQAQAGVLPADTETLVADALQKSDTLIARVIACGLGEPERVVEAASLPGGVQIEILDAIIRLTVETEGGVGKLIEIVRKGVEAAVRLERQETLRNGSRASVDS